MNDKNNEQPTGTDEWLEDALKEHGHTSIADLLKELREDEAAGKREDAHWYPRKLLDEKDKAGQVKERDRGMER